MARKRYTPEEIIGHLRTVEIESGRGIAISDACRTLGNHVAVFRRVRYEYHRKDA